MRPCQLSPPPLFQDFESCSTPFTQQKGEGEFTLWTIINLIGECLWSCYYWCSKITECLVYFCLGTLNLGTWIIASEKKLQYSNSCDAIQFFVFCFWSADPHKFSYTAIFSAINEEIISCLGRWSICSKPRTRQ